MFRGTVALPLFVVAAAAQTQSAWGQCGGNGWSGATECTDAYYCTHANDYYWQCIPGTDPAATTTTSSTLSTTTTSDVETTTTVDSTSTTAETGTVTQTGSTAGPTLVDGWYWIRAVVDPNYHNYLQTSPMGVAGQAYIDDASNAGQFNIADGQLVYNTGAAPLYMHVENPDDKTQRKLTTWFAEDPTDYGTFEFQGDTLTWSVDDIDRQNNAAWLVCEDQELFVNTGAYAYLTPEGCADQTIHSYGGSTASV
ncbi:hypothetical protein MKZ38_006748 [Zalerion maritima]|uniref:CBM1 domain-containing protein n=1 Tax=Zalerion maritima TaxID=339359 RepID=A0AAD5RIJ8_9PEZI|nr:hypothetical protein MKZ38_006748 [Zalerion maritima]